MLRRVKLIRLIHHLSDARSFCECLDFLNLETQDILFIWSLRIMLNPSYKTSQFRTPVHTSENKYIYVVCSKDRCYELRYLLKGGGISLADKYIFSKRYERKKCENLFFIFNKSVHSCKRLYF